MGRKLPPLNAVRAFEAAARHLSFTKAAEELFVTQAAISHQVKGLEAHLGIPLFRRMNRRLFLSDAGQAYLPPLREALDRIEVATQQLYAGEESGSLRVSCLPSFAAKWLLPRLGRFSERQPDIDVLVSAADNLVDFNHEQIDLAIRYGPGNYPGLRVDLLMDDEILPVCSPQLLDGPQPLETPADLKHHTLLHDNMGRHDRSFQDWTTWLKTVGVKGVNAQRGPGFSHSDMVLQAAIDGQGVALGRRSLTADDLAAGRLVSPFGPVTPAPFSYWLVAPLVGAERAKVRHFREWLIEEAGAGESRPALPSSPA